MKNEKQNADLLQWLREQLDEAEKALAARKQMESCWREGTDKTWEAVGCKMNKAQRLRESAMQGRIAKKYQRDVGMIKSVIATIRNL